MSTFKKMLEIFFRCCSEFTSKMESRAGGSTPSSSASRKPFNRSLSNSDVAGYEKNDGSVSDSALSSSVTENRKSRRPSLGYKVAALVGLSKKSSSTSQLPGQGGSEDAEDQSEAQYFTPEGHVTANMGASYEMSSFDSTVGSFDRTGSSFDKGMGSVSRQRSFDREGRSLDRESGSVERGSRSLDRSEGSGRSVDSSVQRSVERAGSFERATGPRTRKEGIQMSASDASRSGMAAYRESSADSVTSGYGSSMSRSTGTTTSSTRSSLHGKDKKGFNKDGSLSEQGSQSNYGRQLYQTTGNTYGTSEKGYDATGFGMESSQGYSETGGVYGMSGYGTDTQSYATTAPSNYETTGYSQTTQAYTDTSVHSDMAAFSNYGNSMQGYGTAQYDTTGYGRTDQGYGTDTQGFGVANQTYGTASQGYDASSYGATTHTYGATPQSYGTSNQRYNDTHNYGSQPCGTAISQASLLTHTSGTDGTNAGGMYVMPGVTGNALPGATSPSGIGKPKMPLGSKSVTDENALFATLGPKPPPRSPTTPTRASAFGASSTDGSRSPADIFNQPRTQSQGPGVGSIVEMGSGFLSKGIQSFKSFF